MLKVDAIASAEAAREPFCFLVTQVLEQDDLEKIRADFPSIGKPGIFPLEELKYGPAFEAVINEMRSPEFTAAVGKQLDIDLTGLPTMVTVRGHAQAKDGRIHTDTKDKVATCLLYLNGAWDEGGGRLRVLRSGHDLEDYIAEVPPSGGTFVAFKVADNSWHGHKPFAGERRYIMMNWMRSDAARSRQYGRHKFSAKVKRLIPFFYSGK